MNLNQVTIPSLDVEKATSFYELLGLQLIVKSLPDYVRFVCPEGSATFSIHRVEELPLGNRAWIYFECDNLNEKVNQLIDSGIEFEELPKDMDWLWREAMLKDLDGNQLLLYKAGENRLSPPWKIN